MAFPPEFLDEIRHRVALSQVIGRKVQLTKRGREFVGLCPFHDEKTPSFTVNEAKGFFHCFGCGAHGDVIGFAMQADKLSFPEAVERLAREAGLEVPAPTPGERARAEARMTLIKVMEAACAWFERQLRLPVGRSALAYLHGRGLDDETIRGFRLGFAPPGRRGADRLLMAGLGHEAFNEEVLVEAGLMRRPEDADKAFDYFRNRIMFPIGDRRGRVIAFGARAMGDGQPKYLNSPETPLFTKGRTLYRLAEARAAAAEGREVIVTEGYMDVIALNRAGFTGAVAPLGTAVTEAQIEALWRLAPEPILCFDGDEAGRRAAIRAAERALPLLIPGKSLRFAELPPGEDPDSLIARGGAQAMREVLDQAEPLVEVVWRMETAGAKIDTPERRADLRRRLRDRAFHIAERSVSQAYLADFQGRLDRAFGRAFTPGGRRQPVAQGLGGLPEGRGTRVHLKHDELKQRILIATALNHPRLMEEFGDALDALVFADADLDRLRRALLQAVAATPGLDAATLRGHLNDRGFARLLDELWQDANVRASFARPDAPLAVARDGWRQTYLRLLLPALRAEFREAQQAFAEALTEDSQSRFNAARERLAAAEQEAAQAEGFEAAALPRSDASPQQANGSQRST
ncbi:MAG: DNA primase [Kiloniellales bacterium]